MQDKQNDRVFIDPFTDFGFKRIFGSEENKDLLIDFLNALLCGRKRITDLTYNRNEYLGHTKDSRKVVYDVICTDNNGGRFIVEVQRVEQEYFRDRCLFYTSTFISDQLRRGMKGWDYRLKDVFLIGIMNFCFDDTRADRYLHDICLSDRHTHDLFYQKLGYLFIEMPKFNKTQTELSGLLDKWLYVLKNLHTLKEIPVSLNNRVFSKLFNIALMSNLTTEERSLYDRGLFREWDDQNAYKFMRKKALKEGRAEGLAKGREKGLAEGRSKGLQEGLEEGLREGLAEGRKEGWQIGLQEGQEQTLRLLVRNCKEKGLSVDMIAEITGLSPEAVAKMD